MKDITIKMKIVLTIFGLFLSFVALSSDFSGDSAKAYLDKLCCREFVGRKSGDSTAKLAEQWVAEKFREFGLKPGGTDGYFQSFPILHNREISASMELVNGYHGGKKYIHGEDFHLITNSGSGDVSAEVVFLGYGICQPEKGRDDYRNIEVAGKIALILKDIPSPARKWDAESSREYKLKTAVEKGAKAVVFLNDTYPISGAAIPRASFYEDIPVIYAAEYIAVDIFRGSGADLENLKNILKHDSHSFDTGRILSISTRLKYDSTATAANVIGIILGSDSALSKEWVIVGAHLDHNGINCSGDVFYGADDNASGTSILIELSRNFANLSPSPKRSTMFIAFAGEEQGLLGSEYFVNNPLISLDSVSSMFNFDCCGIGNGEVGFGGAEHFPKIWEKYKLTKNEDYLRSLNLSMIWGRGSDNHSFQVAGIPTFNYWSSGKRSFYHRVEDTPDKISLQSLSNVGSYSADFIEYFANWNEPLVENNYSCRTLLYSSFAINLHPISLPKSKRISQTVEHLNSLRLQGFKGSLVEINAKKAYDDISFWRNFSADNHFLFAESADAVKNSARKQKLALIPVLCEVEKLNREELSAIADNLSNFLDLGLRIVYIREGSAQSETLKDFLQEASRAGMVLAYKQNTEISKMAPLDAKKLIIANEFSQSSLDTANTNLSLVRIGLPLTNVEITPDMKLPLDEILYLYISVDISKINDVIANLKKLRDSGFKPDEIKYMLGENLLELLP